MSAVIPLNGTIVSTNIPASLTTGWSQVSGAPATITSTGSLTANGTILSTGSYVFRMTTSFSGVVGFSPSSGSLTADIGGYFTA